VNSAEMATKFVQHLQTQNRKERRAFAKKTKTPMLHGIQIPKDSRD
jgi:hypothetical protein